jgi:hypothetical protein
MTPPPSHSRKRLPRSLHALLIVALLGFGCDLFAVPAWRACQLRMPFRWVISLTPLLVVVAMLSSVCFWGERAWVGLRGPSRMRWVLSLS